VKKALVEPDHESLSVRRQCELLDLSRASLYYEPAGESAENLHLMRVLDEQFTLHPAHGVEYWTAWLRQQGYLVNVKRVRRLLRTLGLMAIYPKPKLSQPAPGVQKYPYLLRGLRVARVNQVWSTDITYVRLHHGFVYLVAVLDWYSRYVLSWELSVTLDSEFCVSALERALRQYGNPEIFNTDQGVQFTSRDFLAPLQERGIRISMDGKGRALDNVFVERLWRTVKVEEVYPNDYQVVREAQVGLGCYFPYYNEERLHRSLQYQTPGAVYRQGLLTVA
jgi:putative transposase